MKTIHITICHYQGALKSAVFGLEELFFMANRACEEHDAEVRFDPHIWNVVDMAPPITPSPTGSLIIIPPCGSNREYTNPPALLLEHIQYAHAKGSVVASACAGSFLLAASGIVLQRSVTTHWGLSEEFRQRYPNIPLDTNALLINHGDVITAGGMMSWLDLGLEMVAQYASLTVMRQLGKLLVVDTAPREQRFYQQFTPSFDHGDIAIIAVQHTMLEEYSESLSIAALAQRHHLTERTMQRRFVKATGFNPNEYMQRLRVQKMCDLLECRRDTFESIARQVGYEDPSASRKVFIKIMGLTPKAFRERFANRT